VGEGLEGLVHVLASDGAIGVKGGLDLAGAGGDAVEAPILDLERQRLPERGDLGVGPAGAERAARPLGEVPDEVQEAGNRVAVGVV